MFPTFAVVGGRTRRRVAPPGGGGGAGLPSWVPSAQWAWAQIPNSTMPAPAIAHRGIEGPSAIYTQWNGFAFDDTRNIVYAAGLGGHNAYAWNGAMKLTLGETPSFTEVNPGSALANYTVSAQNYYSDGLPSSVHSGYGHIFDVLYGSQGRAMRIGGSRYNDGGNTTQFDFFDPATNTWAAQGTMPNIANTGFFDGLMAFTRDPRNGNIYCVVQNTTMVRWNWSNTGGSWTLVNGSSGIDGYLTASAFDTIRNRIFYLGGGTTANRHTYDIAGNTTTARTVTGAPTGSSGLGLVFVPGLDAYLARQNVSGGAMTLIDANTFAVSTPTTSGGSSIPIGTGGGHPYTKFIYAPLLKSVLLFPVYGQPGWVCRVEP